MEDLALYYQVVVFQRQEYNGWRCEDIRAVTPGLARYLNFSKRGLKGVTVYAATVDDPNWMMNCWRTAMELLR